MSKADFPQQSQFYHQKAYLTLNNQCSISFVQLLFLQRSQKIYSGWNAEEIIKNELQEEKKKKKTGENTIIIKRKRRGGCQRRGSESSISLAPSCCVSTRLIPTESSPSHCHGQHMYLGLFRPVVNVSLLSSCSSG